MPIGTPTGYLDITNATLRGSQIVTTGYVGIANANPVNHLSVGSNLHINDTHSNILQISGNINAAGVVLGGISIAPTFDLEIVTNTGNTTPYTVEFNNTATAFVTTANATIGDTLTASKLVGDGSAISEIQSSNVSDFASNVTRIGILETDLGSNVTRIETLETDFGSNVTRIETLETDFGSNVTRVETLETDLGSNVSRIGTLETDLGSNVTRIETLETDLGSNVTRITNLESGDLTIDGEKTFSSNLEVGTASLFVDATSGNVGIGTNSPQDTLHLYGSPLIQHSDSYNLSSAGWRKIGTFTASEAGARLKIRILGSFQYGAGSSRGGQTEIYGSINNGVGSVCNMSGTYNYIGQPAVTSVKFVQTGASELEYEVRAYFQTVTAHSFSVECTRGVFVRSWTASSDPGNNSSTVEAAILTHNISENGNVGIGTSSAEDTLHVEGGNIILSDVDGRVNDIIYAETPSDPASNGNVVLRYDGLSSGPANKFYIGSLYPSWPQPGEGFTYQPSTGKVGIGVADPEAKLQVNTYGGESSTNCLIIGASTSNQNLRIGVDSGGQYCWIQSHQGKPLRLNPAGNSVQYGSSNTNLSDDRIKDNEVYIENATDTLLKLKPQIYDKKLIWNISKLGESSNVNVVRESGLITQDVWYDAPELRHLVHLGEDAEPGEDKPVTDNDPTIDPDYTSWGDNVSLLDYTGLIPYLIKSNQELYTEIQTLKSRIASLENP